jgi:predicted TIM-barrel fold metal-dependent hydrolase
MTSQVQLKRDTGTPRKLQVVDADGHYHEPFDVIHKYIDPKYRDVAPRQVTRPDGSIAVVGRTWASEGIGVYGNPLMKRQGAGLRLFSTHSDEQINEIEDVTAAVAQGSTGALRELEPAIFNPEARLKVMDEEGWDAAVLYPSSALAWVPDSDYHLALSRALDDWLAEFCRADPGRLLGATNVVAIHDVDAAIAEVRRGLDQYGFRAVFLRTCLAKPEDRWWGDQYDKFWAACQEMDVAIGFHPFPGDTMYGAARYFDMAQPTPVQTFIRTPFTTPIDAIHAMMGLLVGGIPERFPRLRFGILEASGGWLVSMLERLDHRYEYMAHLLPELKMKPSDYFRRNFWISFDPEEATLPLTAKWLGADRIIWGSDYPHPDAFYPGFVQMLNENIAALSPEDQERIRGKNAAEFYKLA